MPPSVIMCNNDCSVKLNSERSFLVKFGIFASRINFLFYSIGKIQVSLHKNPDLLNLVCSNASYLGFVQ